MPSSLASAAICSVLRVILRVVSVMAVSRCLAILYLSMILLVLVDDLADLEPDLVRANQAAFGDRGQGLGERGLGGGEQFLAFAGPFFGEVGVAAGAEAFPGVVGVADLG